MAQLSNILVAARDHNFSRQQQQQQQQQIQLARPGYEEFLNFYSQQQRLQQRRDDVGYEGIRAIYSSRDGDDAATADQSHGSLSLGAVLRRSSGISNLQESAADSKSNAIAIGAGEWHSTEGLGLNRGAPNTTNSGNESHQQNPDDQNTINQQQTNLSDEANKSLQSVEDMASLEAEQQKRQQMMQMTNHQQLETMSFNMRQRAASGNTIACQDCGNQAKKDCTYMRCRTCCKSRGFECATHIRSTWVPAAKRRERQQAELAAIVSGQPLPKSKRARTLATLAGAVSQLQCTSMTAHNSNPNSNSVHPSFQSATAALAGSVVRHAAASDQRFNPLLAASNQVAESMVVPGALPLEIKAQALFQCVRMSSIADGQDEYAYRAVVRIGGRVFKGILHDHGSSETRDINVPPSSIVSELQLGAARTAASTLAMTSGLTDLGIFAAPGSAILGNKESNMPGPF